MPNWINNMVYISSKDKNCLSKIKEYLKSNYGDFDFAAVIEPNKSTSEAWGTSRNAKEIDTEFNLSFIQALLVGLPKINYNKEQESILELISGNIESFSLAKELIKNIKLPTVLSFIEDDFIFYSFQTAWSMPHYVFVEISNKFPNCSLNVIWADEDIGSNCGIEIYKQGNSDILFISEDKNRDWTKEQYIRFACIVNGYDYEDYKK